ncbi:MAG: hemolysin III family protein, partial [Proteocatella sp.]
ALIWSLAIVGIIIKLCFFNAPRLIGTAFYIILGWMVVFFLKDIIEVLPPEGLFLLAAGGISYTIGGILYIIKKPNLKYINFHDIFHIFVLIGTGLQFFAVYFFIL